MARPGVATLGASGFSLRDARCGAICQVNTVSARPARAWRSFAAVEFASLELVDGFNNHRLMELIGNIPPAEAEERYYALLDAHKLAA